MKLNLPPFYVGQKVVYITGKNMPKGSVHVVSEFHQRPCGCWHMGIDNVPIGFDLSPNDKPILCMNCGDSFSNESARGLIVSCNNWEPKSFRAFQQQTFPLIKLSKIVEKEKEEILIEN